jgi:aminodeoxyfutalosine deaminase
VHLEGTVRADTLRRIAKRNDYALPDGVETLQQFRDFRHFIEVFELRMGALLRYDDFRTVVVEYAAEAAAHGAVYLEGIFSPGLLGRGLDQDEVFSGYTDGAQEARERYDVEVRLTPDLPVAYSAQEADRVARFAVKYRGRGVVGLGLVGLAPVAGHPFPRAFALARDGGLGVVPHAGEIAGPESVRHALEVLRADRIRHGIRAEEEPALVADLASRGTVLDVCPLSNLRTGVVRSLADHPLPRLVAAGVRCSISTDDPAMFDTDLTREYSVATSFGLDPRSLYEAGVSGALCDDATRARLRRIGEAFDWRSSR